MSLLLALQPVTFNVDPPVYTVTEGDVTFSHGINVTPPVYVYTGGSVQLILTNPSSSGGGASSRYVYAEKKEAPDKELLLKLKTQRILRDDEEVLATIQSFLWLK